MAALLQRFTMVLRALPLLVALSLLLVAPPVAGLSPLLSAPAPATQRIYYV